MTPALNFPDGFKLRRGAGGSVENGMCFMGLVAFIAGERITDRPECVCPVLAAHGRCLNDRMTDNERQRLIPLAHPTAGTVDPSLRSKRVMILSNGHNLMPHRGMMVNAMLSAKLLSLGPDWVDRRLNAFEEAIMCGPNSLLDIEMAQARVDCLVSSGGSELK